MDDFQLNLGGCRVRVKTNGGRQLLHRYIEPDDTQDSAEPFRTIIAVVGKMDDNVERSWSAGQIYRSDWALKGYYSGHYFGDPVLLRRVGTTYIVSGPNLAVFLWRYLIKLILADFARERAVLHFKCACVSQEGRGCLIFGLSKAGKTTLVQALVAAGADFVSNTHTFVNPATMQAIAVRSKIRVRGRGYEKDGPESPAGAADLMHEAGAIFPQANIREGAKIESMFFLQRVPDAPSTPLLLPPDQCALILHNLFISTQFYDIQHDIIEDNRMSLIEYSDYIAESEASIRKVADSSRSYYLPVSRITDELAREVLKLI